MRLPKLFFLFLITALGLFEPISAAPGVTIDSIGKPIQVFGVAQQDLNGDGTPDVTVIDCAFATGHDRVLVYDQNGNMPAGNQWEEITDFRDDVWVFDAGADGTAQLIVDFDVEGERNTALVYDDINGDGQVSYRVAVNQVEIEESRFWHLKVESDRPWTQPGGLFDTDMTFSVDGYDGLVLYLDRRPGDQDKGVDGVVDWQLDIGDQNGDGINDYQLQRAISLILIERHIWQFPTAIYAQTTGRRPTPYANTIFWPLLIGKHDYEGYRYFDHPPAMAVDWEKGTIDRIGILGYPIEEGFHIYSRLPLEKDTINAANFENPMAYYDMANDQDGWPELQVRFQVAVPFDPSFPSYPNTGRVETPNIETCYSWDQDNDGQWDYRIDLGANYPVTEVVKFPDFGIKSVPYDEIIPWVRDRTWDVAMLVFDDRPSRDSEGMFGKGWHIIRGYAEGTTVMPSGVNTEYLMGFSDRPPSENYRDIQEGMRGEYSFQYFDTPRMYLSALDRQLHLSGAQAGVWHLGEGHRLRYANLNGDAYLDQWQEERDGEVIQQLNYGHGVFVYNDNRGVRVKQSAVAPAVFETQPPGSYDEWQRLDEQLKANPSDFAPEDFLGMFGDIEGHETQIRRAALRDFRVTSDGFRFVLTLEPGYQIVGPDLLALRGLEPGEYAVENHDGTFAVSPLTPAQLSLALQQPAATGDPAPAQFIVQNKGMADASGLTLVAEIVGNDGKAVELALKPVDALAGRTAQVSIDVPFTAGTDAFLRARLEDGAGQVVAELEPTPLLGAPAVSRDAIFSIWQAPIVAPVVGVFAALLALAAVLAVNRRREQAT